MSIIRECEGVSSALSVLILRFPILPEFATTTTRATYCAPLVYGVGGSIISAALSPIDFTITAIPAIQFVARAAIKVVVGTLLLEQNL